MIFGYARCSTNEQKQDIKRQIQELEAMGAKKIYHEFGTGSDPDRRQLKLLLKRLKTGDKIIATELSRLTRSVHHLCHILELAAEKQATIQVGGFIADCTKGLDPMAEGMIYMMGTFSQLERRIITQRVKSGVDHARSKGIRLGRPPMTKDQLPQKFIKHVASYENKQISITEFAKLVGCSRQSIYRYLLIFRKS